MLALLADPARGATVNLASGTGGTTLFSQSFNETRGADVTILTPDAQSLSEMELQSFNVLAASGTLGARVYDQNTHVLIAAADRAVSSGNNQTLSIPIAATLLAGHTYRICFFVDVGGFGGSGTMFDPAPAGPGGTPYVDATGTVRVEAIWENPNDGFPENVNGGLPLMLLRLAPANVDLTLGPSGTYSGVPQSFNETRGVDVLGQGVSNFDLVAMTLDGLYISTPAATVGARVYSNISHTLVASADVSVTSGANQRVTLPIEMLLLTGSTYRVCFFVDAGGFGGTGTLFDPAPPSSGGFPYLEGTGEFQVLGAYSTANDVYPANVNNGVPHITLWSRTAVADVPISGRGVGQWVVESVRPNPVLQSGTLEFDLPERSRVVLEQFSVTGERMARTESDFDPGRHSFTVASRGLPEGVYFLRFDAFAPSGALRFRTSRKVAILGR